MQNQITQQQSQIQQHKDQYNILKLKLGKDSQGLSSSQGEGAHVNGLHSEELSQLREEVEELRRQHTLQHTQLSDKDSLINTLRCGAAAAAQTAEGGAGGSDNTELLGEVESLRSRVQAQCAEISQLQTERLELIRRAEAVSSAPASSSESSADTVTVSELESRLAAQTTEAERLKEECRGLREGHAGLEQQLASAQSTVAIEQTEKTKLQQEVQESKKEQDDLLMLLADQDQKILNLKQRLRDLGETIDEDEDELDARDQFGEDDDDDDEDEDNND
ncbi:general vesicular transport factor p115 [Oncorhynchus mykiss]|nr:general vesicular transport factor p115 [Oncorhynchus mykiss]